MRKVTRHPSVLLPNTTKHAWVPIGIEYLHDAIASTRCLSAVEPGACFSIASYFETVTCPYVQFLTSHRCFPPLSIPSHLVHRNHRLPRSPPSARRASLHLVLPVVGTLVRIHQKSNSSWQRGTRTSTSTVLLAVRVLRNLGQSSLAVRAAVWEHRTCASNSKIGSLGQDNRPKPWATEFSSSTPSPSAALTPKSASPLFFSIIFFCLFTATPPRHLPTWGFDEPCRPHLHLKLLWSLPLCPQLIALECNDMASQDQ